MQNFGESVNMTEQEERVDDHTFESKRHQLYPEPEPYLYNIQAIALWALWRSSVLEPTGLLVQLFSGPPSAP